MTNKVSRWNAPYPHRPTQNSGNAGHNPNRTSAVVAYSWGLVVKVSHLSLERPATESRTQQSGPTRVRLNNRVPQDIPRLQDWSSLVTLVDHRKDVDHKMRVKWSVKPTFSRGGKACSPGPHGPARCKWLQKKNCWKKHQNMGMDQDLWTYGIDVDQVSRGHQQSVNTHHLV